MLIVLFASGCVAKTNYDYLEPVEYQPTKVSAFVDELGYDSIKLQENRDIKILQITDTHIGNGILCVKKDKKALDNVCELIKATNPDLIVLTGDVVYPISIATGTNDNLSALKVIAGVIESFKTPWTMCFGNHDAESVAKFSKSELCDYLESSELKYCLFSRGPSDIDGMGNHVINVYNSNNSLNTSLFIFDNGEYKNGYQLSGYRTVSQNQTDWYTDSLQEINDYAGQVVQSFIFLHVPLKEYDIAWQSYRAGDTTNVVYNYGWANESKEKVSSSDDEGPLFSAVLELGSTKGIFCGHNHLNDFSVTYYGVRLTFGKSIDYIAYPGIANKTEQRGATLLKLKGLNSSMTANFEITPIKVVDLAN